MQTWSQEVLSSHVGPRAQQRSAPDSPHPQSGPARSARPTSFRLEPSLVSQGDIEALLHSLFLAGQLRVTQAGSTVSDFSCPAGHGLDRRAGPDRGHAAPTAAADRDRPRNPIIPHEEETSSLFGLGGYHGSIHVVGPDGRASRSITRWASSPRRFRWPPQRHPGLRRALEEHRGHVLPAS